MGILRIARIAGRVSSRKAGTPASGGPPWIVAGPALVLFLFWPLVPFHGGAGLTAELCWLGFIGLVAVLARGPRRVRVITRAEIPREPGPFRVRRCQRAAGDEGLGALASLGGLHETRQDARDAAGHDAGRELNWHPAGVPGADVAGYVRADGATVGYVVSLVLSNTSQE